MARRRLRTAIREQVRARANERCEYCRKPEGVSLYPHHADHILPLKHGGDDALDNLAWACFRCNVSKGSNVSSYDPDGGELTPLFNPRMQTWADHFTLDGAHITGKTPVGRVTVLVLHMNHPTQIQTREALIPLGVYE